MNGYKLPDTPHPYWLASTDRTDYPSLEENISVDAVIIGGGLVGITTALLLKNEGLKVAVVEADRIVQGTTAHTTAKVTSQHGLIYNQILTKMGQEKAKQYAEANEYAISFIANMIKKKHIDCDFSWESSYVYTQSDQYIQKIHDEVEAASSLGIKASFVDKIPFEMPVKGAVRFENQAQFHPRKYLLALAKDIPGDGSHIFENTRIIDIDEGEKCAVIAENGKKITASHVVIASHFPCYDGKGLYFTRMLPKRSYILAVKAKEKYPGGMYMSAEEPGRSLRSQVYGNSELILVGGEHHKTGHGTNMMNHYENLREFISSMFTIEDIPYRWSTQDYTTLDRVPYTGHLTSSTFNIYVATGFRKWGMTNSTASAIIIKDLIIKKENPWAPVYNPSRTTINSTSVKNFIEENADVAKNYIKDKLEPLEDNVSIKIGDAKKADVQGHRAGVYRDDNGKLHIIDTTCTHMGCELHWNDAEKSWDCPCHGSRFTYEGDIIEGPALMKLSHDLNDPNKKDPNLH